MSSVWWGGYSTERAYAVGALEELERAGFTIRSASDGEERLRGPMPASAAVDHVRAAEHGSVLLEHPEHGRVTLCLLFQNGAPEEVIYDMGAANHGTFDVVDAILEPLRAK